jgi:hypothetical protein
MRCTRNGTGSCSCKRGAPAFRAPWGILPVIPTGRTSAAEVNNDGSGFKLNPPPLSLYSICSRLWIPPTSLSLFDLFTAMDRVAKGASFISTGTGTPSPRLRPISADPIARQRAFREVGAEPDQRDPHVIGLRKNKPLTEQNNRTVTDSEARTRGGKTDPRVHMELWK